MNLAWLRGGIPDALRLLAAVEGAEANPMGLNQEARRLADERRPPAAVLEGLLAIAMAAIGQLAEQTGETPRDVAERLGREIEGSVDRLVDP